MKPVRSGSAVMASSSPLLNRDDLADRIKSGSIRLTVFCSDVTNTRDTEVQLRSEP